MTIGLTLLAFALIGVGLCGAVVPIIPGIPILYGGLWLAAAIDGYRHVGAAWLAGIAILGALGWAVDLAAGALGAARVGASRQAVWGALLGTAMGVPFGIPGIVLGPFLGAVAGQLMVEASMRRAAEVGIGAWVGLLLGAVVKWVTSIGMLGSFGLAWWLNRAS